MESLSKVDVGYKSSVCLCYDNFSGHKTKLIMDFLESNDIWHMPTGKASYKANPIECTFALAKMAFQRLMDNLIQEAWDPSTNKIKAI